jgi:hypothetical protein
MMSERRPVKAPDKAGRTWPKTAIEVRRARAARRRRLYAGAAAILLLAALAAAVIYHTAEFGWR